MWKCKKLQKFTAKAPRRQENYSDPDIQSTLATLASWRLKNPSYSEGLEEDWKRDASSTACGETPQPRGAGTGGRGAVLRFN